MNPISAAKEGQKERNINTLNKKISTISTHVLSIETSGAQSHQNEILDRLLNQQSVYGSSGQITAVELFPRFRLAYSEPQKNTLQLRQSDDTTLIAGLYSLTEHNQPPPHPLIANIDASSLDSKDIDYLPPEDVIFVLDFHQSPSAAVLDQIKKRKSAGFRLIINHQPAQNVPPVLIGLIREARLDVGQLNATELENTSKTLRHAGMNKLIAANIGCQESLDLCHKLLFDEFQGSYCDNFPVQIKHPTEISRLRLLELIDRVIARNDLSDIESMIKADARMTYQLIAYVNTLNNNDATIDSLTQAVQQIKHDGLYRWLTLLLHTSVDLGTATMIILKRGLSRGFFLETLARKSLHQLDPQAAYLIGLLSVIDKLIDQPITNSLGRLKLSADIKIALIEYKGIGGLMLKLAIAVENGEQPAIESLAARCLVSSVDVNLAMINALVLTETTPL